MFIIVSKWCKVLEHVNLEMIVLLLRDKKNALQSFIKVSKMKIATFFCITKCNLHMLILICFIFSRHIRKHKQTRFTTDSPYSIETKADSRTE